MKITNCKVNHINEPMGFVLENPVFSWNVEECEEGDSPLYTKIVVRKSGQRREPADSGSKGCVGQKAGGGKTESKNAESKNAESKNAESKNAEGIKAGDASGAEIVVMGWTKLEYFHTGLKLDLEPRTVYEWQICVKNDAGEEAEAVHFFETGKMDEAWQAKWITCDRAKGCQVVGACSADRRERLPFFEKDFVLNPKEKVKKARLYICGLGLYEAYLNGRRVGDEYLAPGCTAYDQYAQSYTYDVTKLLGECVEKRITNENSVSREVFGERAQRREAEAEGEKDAEKKNAADDKETVRFSVLMGDGWYKGRYDFEKFTEPFYGNRFLLIAELHIDYESGRTEVVCTDESFRVRRSNILFSGIYDGEIVDDTLEELPEEKVILCEAIEGEKVTSGQGKDFRLPKLRDRLSLPVKTHEA